VDEVEPEIHTSPEAMEAIAAGELPSLPE